MKTKLFTTALLMIISLFEIPAFSQINPFTNGFTKISMDENVPAVTVDNPINTFSTSGVTCNDNTFWAIDQHGSTADLFSLESGVITKTGSTTFTGTNDPDISYCNNLNGGVFSPTFYSVYNFNQPAYYNGSGFIATSVTASNMIADPGGYGNYLYYMLFNSSYKPTDILRFDGSALTSVYTFLTTEDKPVADIAVDSDGNAWFFTGPDASHSEMIKVVSPVGQLLRQYPFIYNTLNAYGCFFLHEILYIGLGAANVTSPNTIVPISFTGSIATAGAPIPMPDATVYYDMASCSVGSPLSISDATLLKDITVSPNPFSDKIIVNDNSGEPLEIILYDVTARVVLHEYSTNSVILNAAQLSKGTYLYKVINKTGMEKTGKIVKE